jgi:hypothetical protein
VAFTPGFRGWFMLDGANGAGTNVSAYLDNITFPQSVAMLEVTTLGSTVQRFIPGLTEAGQVQVSGPFDTGLGTIINNCLAAQAAGTAGFTAVYGPAGSVASTMKQTAEVLIASFETSVGVGGRAEFSATLQIDGAVTNATW